jgi:hypothetical protein
MVEDAKQKYPKPFSACEIHANEILIRWLGSIHGLGNKIRDVDS